MAFSELETLKKIKNLVKGELQKIKPSVQEDTPNVSLNVTNDVNLSDEQFDKQKQILKTNLSNVMQLSQVEDIVNDVGLITPSNIYFINKSWNNFIKDINTHYQSITFSTFRVLFENFIKKLTEPNKIDEKLNRLQGIIDLLRTQENLIRNSGPKVEEIINLLRAKFGSIPTEKMERIQQKLGKRSLSLGDLQSIKTDLGASASSSAGKKEGNVKYEGEAEDEEEDFDEGEFNIPAVSASSSSKSSQSFFTEERIKSKLQKMFKDKNQSKVKTKLQQNFKAIQEGSDADKFFSTLSKNEKNELLSIVALLDTDKSKRPAGKQNDTDILKGITGFVQKFKEQKVLDLIKDKPLDNETKVDAMKKANTASNKLFGLGVQKEDKRTRKEQTVPFGVLQINLDKLNNGYLKLIYNNSNLVKELKLTKISDNFKVMVKDILSNKKFSDYKFNKLDDDEKLMYKMMIKKARLAGDLDVRLDQLGSSAVDVLKNEWNILFGQIQSGNDSPELRKKAKDLIKTFIQKKLISKNEGMNILLNL